MQKGDIVVVEEEGKPPWVGKFYGFNGKGDAGVLFSPTDIRWVNVAAVRKQ